MATRHLKILAVGRNADIMEVLQRLLNAPDHWSGLAVTTDEAAFQALADTAYDIILLCAGITEEEETILRARLQALAPAAIIRRHYGGGSGLLSNEIQYILDNK